MCQHKATAWGQFSIHTLSGKIRRHRLCSLHICHWGGQVKTKVKRVTFVCCPHCLLNICVIPVLLWDLKCSVMWDVPSRRRRVPRGLKRRSVAARWLGLRVRIPPGSICSCSKAVYKPVCHIPLLSVQWINSWWWTEELSETCRVSLQNKFVKLVHLRGLEL